MRKKFFFPCDEEEFFDKPLICTCHTFSINAHDDTDECWPSSSAHHTKWMAVYMQVKISISFWATATKLLMTRGFVLYI